MREHKDQQTPLWLTDAYLEKCVKKYLKNYQVKIINTKIEPTTSNGYIYNSLTKRIKIEYILETSGENSQELFFLLKHSYDNDPFISDIMSGYYIYNTEMKMYKDVLPQLVKILQKVGDTEKLFAKTLNVDFEKSAIIFEDLTVKNYLIADRLKGLNEEHARLVLKQLAKLHAAAAVLNQRLNGELEQFQRGPFNRQLRTSGCLFENVIEVCAKFADNCPELGSYYRDKLLKIKPYIVDYGIKAYNINPKHFNTLCHGDLWTNNILMHYEPLPIKYKVFKEVLFKDYQLCNWSSPAIDLHYFFHTSLESKLQLSVYSLQKLVQYYHGILVDVLGKLNFMGFIPTLRELHVQLEEGKFLAFTAATISRAILTNNPCDNSGLQTLLEDDERSKEFRNKLYQNKNLQSDLKCLLPYFDGIGLLDVQ